MPDVTRRRCGELVRPIYKILWDKPEGLPVKEVLKQIPHFVTLTDFESGHYPSDPNSSRYEKIVRFATIADTKAGWLVKSKGRWFITEEGRQAYNKYPDPEAFYKEAARLYHEWRRNRPVKATPIVDEGEVEAAHLTVEEAEEKATDQIQKYLQSIKAYEFQELVADLLRAMDYHVSWVAPPGKDRGIDIIAYTDPLGASIPRIKVQVKHRPDSPTTVEGLRAFMSVLGIDDLGLFMSSGGFTSDAKEEARTQERRKITLLDLENFVDLWIEHYEKLSQEARQRFPLKPIYFLAPAE